ncbi:hypothetical protein K493DRAFT_306579 [Basidiobolus meristosporus CBS 931.73]|uniref:G-protein coupled receptors family 1 profile domain-containing protein n=1 Tax=Basidiobolus meristosporus CBS 931.73 TaxID=1314790 RepID=A0A1Y1XRW9_9FUNG|nr:hypothetical protein K493DRAFT_306579 [Basidiobolus meristosporus CBS 931.73]|eukprot:ORX88498.1 hypothetical protein K493DRAFT_306579 [Basidiobolus meristosporus CBS 931.73]
MATSAFILVAHYVVGLCFGLTLVVIINFALIRGWRTDGIISHRILYLVAFFNSVYAQVKIVQMNGSHDDNCIIAENLSVFFYHGSNTLQFIYYMARYREVYGGSWSLLFPALTTVVYAAGIPLSIILNETSIAPDNSCIVTHPRVSSLLPLITAFIVAAYMMVMFLTPFVQQSLKTKGDQNSRLMFVARNLFITNTIAILFNMFFNISLITPLEQYAPMLSMIDLTINIVMVCLPYFLTRLRGSTGQWSSTPHSADIPRDHISHHSHHECGPASPANYYQERFGNPGGHKLSGDSKEGEIPLVLVNKRFQNVDY